VLAATAALIKVHMFIAHPAANKNHLELRSNSPQWIYSTAPLVKPDGTPVDPPAAGAAGYALALHDKQVGGSRGGDDGASLGQTQAALVGGLLDAQWMQHLVIGSSQLPDLALPSVLRLKYVCECCLVFGCHGQYLATAFAGAGVTQLPRFPI
jgi:hypothetical protein